MAFFKEYFANICIQEATKLSFTHFLIERIQVFKLLSYLKDTNKIVTHQRHNENSTYNFSNILPILPIKKAKFVYRVENLVDVNVNAFRLASDDKKISFLWSQRKMHMLACKITMWGLI